ncbi:MAG: AP2 domain-containing protein [Rubricoccaceae bacterium]
MALETAGAPQRRLHHITRIDIEPSGEHPRRHPTHGWQVRHRRDGQRLSKFFADARNGGRDEALEAAIAYRDQLFANLPTPERKPRKAWSNTGVVGLSVREKAEGARPKLYVQLNWMDADGKRRASSYSVEKWGLRRALWNGCLKLYRERQDAGAPVEEPHVMFARAQEPFQDQIRAEIAADELANQPLSVPELQPVSAQTVGDVIVETPRPRRPRPETELASEDDRLRQLEDALFG